MTPRLASTFVCLAAAAGLAALCLRGTDGRLVYTLDDPYIHLAVTENILRGGYGVNLEEYSSPSSSILWPWLMAVPMALGLADSGPLLVGIGCMALTVWLLGGLLQTRAWTILLVFALNAAALPMTGMEHPLHVLASVMLMLGLRDLPGRVSPLLTAGIILCPLVRFEGLALAVAGLGALVWCRRYRAALLTGGALAGALGLWVWRMRALGLPALPSSVLVKSNVSAQAVDRNLFSVLAGIMGNVAASLTEFWGVIFLAGAGLLLWRFKARPLVALPAVFALGAHVAFGRYGWFGRYEVYAVAILLAAIALTQGFRVQLALLALGAAAYVPVTVATPAGARNVWQQQVQMHRFATEYFPHPVAVNDLGQVAYRNHRFVLDLWGLGSEEARRLGRTPETLRRLTTRRAVKFAMLYDEWFRHAIPPEWKKMAVLRTSRVTAAYGEVSFYLLDSSLEAEMSAALARWRGTLPDGASLSPLGP